MIERDVEPGGILLQCIHNGFGLEIFKQDLPGPAYAQHFIQRGAARWGSSSCWTAWCWRSAPQRRIYGSSSADGCIDLQARALVLAMGCRERTRAQVRLPGTRPAGVYHRRHGAALGERGRLYARQALRGAGFRRHRHDHGPPPDLGRRQGGTGAGNHALPDRADAQLRAVPAGLRDPPAAFAHGQPHHRATNGWRRSNPCAWTRHWNPIPGTEEIIPCDTLLLSVGLIPENELSRKAGVALDPVTGGPGGG